MNGGGRARRRPRGATRTIGIVLLMLVIFLALAGPRIAGVDPGAQEYRQLLLPPSADAPLGTDELGRSVLARVAAATRLSLGLGVVAVLTGALIGTIVGIAAAWRGGWGERVLATIADTALALPGLVLVLLIVAALPGSYAPLYLGFALTLWVEYFRIVRTSARAVLVSQNVQASRLLGFDAAYILRRHMLPELAPVVLTLLPYSLATVVLGLASLGFINVGLSPPTAELGLMMTEYLPYYWDAPWLLAAPVGVLIATVMGLVLIGGRERRP